MYATPRQHGVVRCESKSRSMSKAFLWKTRKYVKSIKRTASQCTRLYQYETSPVRVWKFIAEAQFRILFQQDKTAVGVWIKNEVGALGPAFVKLGQFVSTRQDLFGKEITDQLVLLQDDINPVEFSKIAECIEVELGRPIGDVFAHIDPTYIGTASIGQVHRGKLKISGKDVVIKVQKPLIDENVRDNIETLKNISWFIGFTGMNSARASEFDQIIAQYEQFLSAELDYERELNNMVLFHQQLKGLPVRVPRVYRAISTRRVLVMEYVPSIKITDVDTMTVMGFDKSYICDTLVKVFLAQIIDRGIVHNDTQQGNLGVLNDGKTIVLYDFGNVIRFSSEFKESISLLVFAIVQKDVDEFVDMMVRLGILYVADDSELLEVKTFFSYFFKYLDGLDMNALKKSIVQSDMEGKFQENLSINPDFLSLFRVFSLLDGTIARLDPTYSYTEAMRPYAQNVMSDSTFWDTRARKDILKLTTYPRAIDNADANIVRVQTKVTSMSRDMQSMQAYIMLAIVFEHLMKDSNTFLIILPYLYYLFFNNRKK